MLDNLDALIIRGGSHALLGLAVVRMLCNDVGDFVHDLRRKWKRKRRSKPQRLSPGGFSAK
jgi:hypothetical protein